MNPSLWTSVSEVTCKEFYVRTYCPSGVKAFDGILVRVSERTFMHAFYESPGKTVFSLPRAQRAQWIALLLADPAALLVCGYDKKRDTYSRTRRVALWPEERYLVVVQLDQRDPKLAHFITAFYVDGPGWKSTLEKLVRSPRWFV